MSLTEMGKMKKSPNPAVLILMPQAGGAWSLRPPSPQSLEGGGILVQEQGWGDCGVRGEGESLSAPTA